MRWSPGGAAKNKAPGVARTVHAEDSLLTLMLDSPSGKEKKSSRLEECNEEQEPLPDASQPGTSQEPGDGAPRGGGAPEPSTAERRQWSRSRGLLPGRRHPRQQAEAAQEPAENKGVPQANLLSFQDKEEETKEVLNVKKSSESKR